MRTEQTVTVHAIAFLDTFCKEKGIPSTQEVEVAPRGIVAGELAQRVGLPVQRIEGVFLNHRTRPLDALVLPGDRVAFVPPGTPASHPAFFGAFDKTS